MLTRYLSCNQHEIKCNVNGFCCLFYLKSSFSHVFTFRNTGPIMLCYVSYAVVIYAVGDILDLPELSEFHS